MRSKLRELASEARNGNLAAEEELRRLLTSKKNQRLAKEIVTDKRRFKIFNPKFGSAFKPLQGGAPGLGKKS